MGKRQTLNNGQTNRHTKIVRKTDNQTGTDKLTLKSSQTDRQTDRQRDINKRIDTKTVKNRWALKNTQTDRQTDKLRSRLTINTDIKTRKRK